MYDPTVQGHIPFPAFAPNGVFETTESTSNYNSFQVVYEHQLSAGLTVLANYTYSKCMTDQRSMKARTCRAYRAPWLPGFGQAADYGLCSSDTAQVVHASGTYDLTFWQESGFSE